jgi:hypothetical protein
MALYQLLDALRARIPMGTGHPLRQGYLESLDGFLDGFEYLPQVHRVLRSGGDFLAKLRTEFGEKMISIETSCMISDYTSSWVLGTLFDRRTLLLIEKSEFINMSDGNLDCIRYALKDRPRQPRYTYQTSTVEGRRWWRDMVLSQAPIDPEIEDLLDLLEANPNAIQDMFG